MKDFRYIWNEWVCPIVFIVGHILLVYLVFDASFFSSNGWIVAAFAVINWLYGFFFHSDLIPFIKRTWAKLQHKIEN